MRGAAGESLRVQHLLDKLDAGKAKAIGKVSFRTEIKPLCKEGQGRILQLLNLALEEDTLVFRK